MVSVDGLVKILDFGLAKLRAADEVNVLYVLEGSVRKAGNTHSFPTLIPGMRTSEMIRDFDSFQKKSSMSGSTLRFDDERPEDVWM